MNQVLLLSAFDIVVPYLHHTISVFSTLVRLQLAIGIDYEPITARCPREDHAAKALSSAINLECFYMSLYCLEAKPFNMNESTEFSLILGGCQFPKLKSLMLKNFRANEDELLPFILASLNLEHLFMDQILYADSIKAWAHFVDGLRPILPLQSGNLSNLAILSVDSISSQGDIENFAICNIEIAFTTTSRNAGKWPSPQGDWEDHYQWMHRGGAKPAIVQAEGA